MKGALWTRERRRTKRGHWTVARCPNVWYEAEQRRRGGRGKVPYGQRKSSLDFKNRTGDGDRLSGEADRRRAVDSREIPKNVCGRLSKFAATDERGAQGSWENGDCVV